MTQLETTQPLEAARSAFARHSWHEAYERFLEADRGSLLGPADLQTFAEAAWWSAHPEECIQLRERAYAALVESGERQQAARVALLLADDHGSKRAHTIASAWFSRAERLLEGDTGSAAYAWLRFWRGMHALGKGDHQAAVAEGQAALELATRLGERDAQACALLVQGSAMVASGDVAEGLRLLDEATVAAVSGELGLLITGYVYCSTIATCRDLGDYRRASEWTDAARRWCERQSVAGFPGVCRVHRAELLALRGAWAEAEQEARRACEELSRYNLLPFVAEGFYEIGEIRLRMGDLPAAEDAFRQAHELGRVPEPGLSLLRLAQGKVDAANDSLARALANERNRPGRARLLGAQVEVAIAAGDLETARAATAELEHIATSFGSQSLEASARHARGTLQLVEGDAETAERTLRRALQLWQEVDIPYAAAKARVAIAAVARARNDEDSARLELLAAKSTFDRIGASRDARAAAAVLGATAETGAPVGAPQRVTRTFLFTDIVGSTSLIGVIGDDAWQDLIRWHDDALRAVIAEHGGEEIRHQGDGLVVSFADPAKAIECAIAIQRKLIEHRKTHGFSPQVRIGVHASEALRRGLDYAGVGVHEAARIGALAAAGEILVSAATLAASGRSFATGDPQVVQLKGIAEPVEVRPIAWR